MVLPASDSNKGPRQGGRQTSKTGSPLCAAILHTSNCAEILASGNHEDNVIFELMKLDSTQGNAEEHDIFANSGGYVRLVQRVQTLEECSP